MDANALGYVVPTKDRPKDLATLLKSVSAQTVLPGQIVIVDGSNPDVSDVVQQFAGLPITYVRAFPPSLAKQRNAGIAALHKNIRVAGYLDDDLVLEPDATERMLEFWRNAPSGTGGAAFSIINQPRAFNNHLSRLFLLDDPRPGRVLTSGFHSQIPPVDMTTETDWLYGGATLWHRDALDRFSYDEWFIGHGYLEDVDYSYRVRQSFRLFVVGAARCWHFSRPIAREREFMLGRQQVVNRFYFFRKIPAFSSAALVWAMFGQLLFNLASSVRHRDRRGLLRFLGNMVGITSLLTGRQTRIGGYYK